MQPLTLVYIAPFGLEKKTTVWARTLPLAAELVCRGHRATILVPPWDSPASAGQQSVQEGVHVEQMSLGGGIPAVVARLVRRSAALRPDVVHIVKPRAHAGLVQWWLWQTRRRNRAAPKLLLDVDDWEQAWASINHYAPPVARFLAWQEEWGIRHADGITAASRWLMERVQAAAPATPRLYLPNGVSPPAAHPAAAPPEHSAPGPRLLYFSRFVEVPPAWLARCWAALRQAVPSAQLVVAGQALAPHLEEAMRKAIDPIGNVAWLGYIPPAQVGDLYASSTCALFPAAPAPLHQAKCSVRLATALMHGVPVVASAVGEQAAYGAEGAARLVAENASPEMFAAAVVEVLASPGDRAALAETARIRLSARYNWPRLAAELEAFYFATIGD
ncbi:MAG: glycosyltransferase family 4 protein [Caldilineaceae bacterium]|nr:glycosyltransferase family 4 protein [Caldilineaceae bacterium]